jgi:hypothetical protein
MNSTHFDQVSVDHVLQMVKAQNKSANCEEAMAQRTWTKLYQAAVLETDCAAMPNRIKAAREVMEQSLTQSPDAAEKAEIAKAILCLEALAAEWNCAEAIAPTQSAPSPPNRAA